MRSSDGSGLPGRWERASWVGRVDTSYVKVPVYGWMLTARRPCRRSLCLLLLEQEGLLQLVLFHRLVEAVCRVTFGVSILEIASMRRKRASDLMLKCLTTIAMGRERKTTVCVRVLRTHRMARKVPINPIRHIHICNHATYLPRAQRVPQ